MEEKQEVTKNLLKEGMTIEKISKITGQTQQQIKNPEKIEKNRMINPRDEYNRNIGKEEGKIEGKKEGKLEVAKNLLKEGMTIEKISKITGLTEQQIENNL